MPDARTWRVAFVAVWVVISAALMLAVLAPFVLPAESVYRIAPVCEAKLRGSRCVLCGMTTAYVAMARGDIEAALGANRWSLALWAGSILNFAVVKLCLLLSFLRRNG